MSSVPQGAELRLSVVANADLSGKQFHFVKWDSDGLILCAAATDDPAGVLQEDDVVSGRMAEIVAFGPTYIVADAAIVAGALIGTSADGQADTKIPGTDVTEFVAGKAWEAAAGAGNIIVAVVNCISPARAL